MLILNHTQVLINGDQKVIFINFASPTPSIGIAPYRAPTTTLRDK